jgi:predicted alpha-1,6-mannanase (GH76 family)
MMWWVISLSNGYTITKNATYLQHAEKGFAHIWEGSYDKKNGGMFWDFNHSGKNSCINFPTVIAAMKLFNITKDSVYFEKAKNVYEWGRKNLTDTLSGRVADNKIGNHPAGFTDYTYNTGTFIGAAVLLFEATKDSAYLRDAIKSSGYTKNWMCKNGILPAEGDWNEQGVMKSIFAQYISKLIFDCGQTQYLDWIRHNISAAWSHRDANRTLMYRDYSVACPTGNIQSYEASSAVAFMQLFNR